MRVVVTRRWNCPHCGCVILHHARPARCPACRAELKETA